MSRPNSDSASTTKPATIITFRLKDKLAYVPPPENYQEAVKFARNAFKDHFTVKDPEEVCFRRNVKVMGSLRAVDITPMVWKELMATLVQYEIIEVVVPEFDQSITLDVPPHYSEATSKNGRLSPPRGPSPKPSRSPSPSVASRARDWWSSR